jgi:YVTN family beta-propeller protein
MNWSALKGHSSVIRHPWLLLGMLSAAIPLAASSSLIYVANRGGTTIDVIDAATNKVVQTIRQHRVTPDGSILS